MSNWQLIATLAALVVALFGAVAAFANVMSKRIDDLRIFLDARFEAVHAEFKSVRAEFKAESAEARSEFKAEIAEVKAEQRITNHRLESLESRFKPVAAD
jgi:uncharacterized protein YPO0396